MKKPKPNCIDALVREQVRALDAYATPSASGMIKLDAMESPHQLPAKLRKQWLARLAEVEVNRYPDSRCESLKQLIRTTFGMSAEGLVLGNGSDELIQMIAMLVGGRGRVMLAPTPTFSMYQLIAATTGSEFVGVPLRADFSLDGDVLLDTIEKRQPACVFLAYPNNPSGNCFDEAVIMEVLNRAPGLVVLDEAYFAFCARSFLAHVEQFPNLLVLRTLSKSGMAGLRLGMLSCDARWAKQLEKIRLPYNINSLSQCSAMFYLENYVTIQQHADEIISQRKIVLERLTNLPGVNAYPSEANFILFKVERAQQIFDHLKTEGILIKNLHRPATPLENCLRTTIGTEHENTRFIEALRGGS